MIILPTVLFCFVHGSSAQDAALLQANSSPDPQPCLEAPGLSAPKARPFSAKYEERTVRSLADGSTLTTEYRGVISRDSQGRVYRAGSFITPHEKDKVVPEVVIVQISDPTTEMLLSWTTGQDSKIVQRMHIAGASLEPSLLPDSTLPRLGGKIINDIYASGISCLRNNPGWPRGQQSSSGTFVRVVVRPRPSGECSKHRRKPRPWP